MHELAATQNIISLALSEAEKNGASRITRISVKAGEWSTIEPGCVEFYFGILAQGTRAEGAELAIESVPVEYMCSECGHRYRPSDGGFSCPKCPGAGGTLVSGRELYVDSIEVR